MTEQAPETTLTAPDPDGPAPTKDELEAKTKDQLAEDYDLPSSLTKAAMVAAVLERFGVSAPRSGQVTLATNALHSDAHYWAPDEPPITATGTNVPADQAEKIIADAALGGVQIREVN